MSNKIRHDPLLNLVYQEVLDTISKVQSNWPHFTTEAIEGDIRLLVEEVASEHPKYAGMLEEERQRFVSVVTNELTGFGPLTQYLEDEQVSEIMVNGLNQIYIERQGLITAVPDRFLSANQLMRVIKLMVSPLGRRVDELNPMVDGRLPDGSRINVAIPPVALDGPYLTVRKFSKRAFLLPELVQMGTLEPEIAEMLQEAVGAKETIMISGGTGTGKTTLLNVLATAISPGERVVTIEDAAELRIERQHVVRLESRPPSPEGKGEISIRQLVRNALRMRPDRIIIGEVRGAETMDLIQALNTGHHGSLSTVHAENPLQALYRLETMALLTGHEIPLSIIRNQISGAVRYIVHLERLASGQRIVSCVAKIHGCSRGEYLLDELFQAKVAA